MVEIKTNPRHPASMAERIDKRLRNSGDAKHADVVDQHGRGPTRTITNVHHTRNTRYGEGAPEEPGIDGVKRGVV
jgi:hypothetical protein